MKYLFLLIFGFIPAICFSQVWGYGNFIVNGSDDMSRYTYNICSSDLSTTTIQLHFPSLPSSGWTGYCWLVSKDGGTTETLADYCTQSRCTDVILTIPTNRIQTPGVYKYRYHYYRNGSSTTPYYSNTITLTVYSDVNAGTLTQPDKLCPTFYDVRDQVSPSGGDGNYVYSWYASTKSSPSVFNLVGERTYSFNADAATYSNVYRVVKSSCSNSATSNTIALNSYDYLSPGSISGIQTICAGNTPTQLTGTTASNGGQTITYTWYQSSDNVNFYPISNSNTQNYAPSSLTTTTYYKRYAQTDCDSKFSNVITVTVLPQISEGSISVNPTTICYNTVPNQIAGTDATGADGNLSYQWIKSTDGINFNTISGATYKSYSPQNLTASTWYKRTAISSTVCGSKETSALKLTVNPELTVGSIGIDQTVCPSSTVNTITGEASTGADGNLSYQWFSSTNNSTWNAIANTNSKDYTPQPLTATTYFKRKTISVSCGEAFSNVVTISVTSSISAGQITVSKTTVCNGAIMTITNVSAASGSNSINYKWQKYTTQWIDIPGETGLIYTTPQLTDATYKFRRVASYTCGDFPSNEITLSVLPVISEGSISVNPTTICYNTVPNQIAGTDATGADGNLSYQWIKSTDGVNFNTIPGATSKSYSSQNLTSSTYFKRTAISAACGSKETSSLKITVNPQLVAGNIGIDQTVCPSSTVNTITGEASTGADGNLSYQWFLSTNNSTWNGIVSTNSKDYTPQPLTATTYFKRKTISVSCGEAFSNVATVTIQNTVSLNTISANQHICSKAVPALLTGNTSNITNATYKWQSSSDSKNWSDLPLSNSVSYQPSALSSNTYFKRQIITSCETNNSYPVYIELIASPSLPNIGAKTVYCQNENIALIIPDNSLSYEWCNALGNVKSTGNNYSINSIQNNDSIYVRSVDNNQCKSDLKQLVFNVEKVVADFSADLTTIAKGGMVHFTNLSKGSTSYLWDFGSGITSTSKNPTSYFYTLGAITVKLTATSTNYCNNVIVKNNYITVGTTGIENLSSDGVLVYPNPMRDHLTINLQNDKLTKIEIIDLLGRKHIEKQIRTETNIDVSKLSVGVYICNIILENKVISVKLEKL